MLFVVEERLEGFKYNIGLGGGVGSTKGEGTDLSTRQKRRHSQHFCPALQFRLIRSRDVFRRNEND